MRLEYNLIPYDMSVWCCCGATSMWTSFNSLFQLLWWLCDTTEPTCLEKSSPLSCDPRLAGCSRPLSFAFLYVQCWIWRSTFNVTLWQYYYIREKREETGWKKKQKDTAEACIRSFTIPFFLIFPCCVYTLPLHLIQPSGCPLHLVTSQQRDGRMDVEGERKKRKTVSLCNVSRCFCFSVTPPPILSFFQPFIPSFPSLPLHLHLLISISISAHSSVWPARPPASIQ